MATERVVERTDGVTAERTTERTDPTVVATDRRDDSGGKTLRLVITLAVLALLAFLAFQFLGPLIGSEQAENNAVAGAADSVAGAAESVGDAAKSAGDAITPD